MAFKMGHNEIYLPFNIMEDVSVEGLACRFEQPFATRLCHRTGKDNCLRIEYRSIICQTNAQNIPCTAVSLYGQLVTFFTKFSNNTRRQLLHLSHQRWRVRRLKHLTGCTDNSFSCSIGFQTATVAAAALTTAMHSTRVTHFASEAVNPQMYHAIAKEATTHATTHRNNNEIMHAVSSSKCLLAQSHHMSIIGQSYS